MSYLENEEELQELFKKECVQITRGSGGVSVSEEGAYDSS